MISYSIVGIWIAEELPGHDVAVLVTGDSAHDGAHQDPKWNPSG